MIKRRALSRAGRCTSLAVSPGITSAAAAATQGRRLPHLDRVKARLMLTDWRKDGRTDGRDSAVADTSVGLLQ